MQTVQYHINSIDQQELFELQLCPLLFNPIRNRWGGWFNSLIVYITCTVFQREVLELPPNMEQTYPPEDFLEDIPSALPTLLLRLTGPPLCWCGSGLLESLMDSLASDPALELALLGEAETFLRKEFLRRLDRCSSRSRSTCCSTLAIFLAWRSQLESMA